MRDERVDAIHRERLLMGVVLLVILLLVALPIGDVLVKGDVFKTFSKMFHTEGK